MKKFWLMLLFIGLVSCSNQVLPPSESDSDLIITSISDDPPSVTTIDVDERVFHKITTLSDSNEGCIFQPSGPYNRVQTDPDKSENINGVSAALFLPRAPSSAELESPSSEKSRYTPNIYTGGKVENGAAVDVGFASDRNGLWIPFINIRIKDQLPSLSNYPREVINGNTYVYRVKPGTNVSIKV